MNKAPGSILVDTKERSIVIVDDMPDNLRLLTDILTNHGYKVRPAPSGARALATIHKEPPELILLDIMMPGMDGYEVCRQLKAHEGTKDIPIIFLSALNEVFDKVKAFKAGGVDFITKPFQVEEVLARVRTHITIRAQQKVLALRNEELLKKNELITEQAQKLELMATRDFLTGLSNRRDFLERAGQEEMRFKRLGRPFALIMLDIDHFKRVNDTFGHACGDKVLTNVSRALEKALRAQDVLARWGGEEFICLLPETGVDGANCAAEKIRTGMEHQRYDCIDDDVPITVTAGVCVYDGSCAIEECIRRADDALYKGKIQGRNKVVLSV
ncbi:MAG: diguanylate cyclase [Desulfobacteraceae bacterium]|jgi:diguanylate cyclase (GGDEF)-like protein